MTILRGSKSSTAVALRVSFYTLGPVDELGNEYEMARSGLARFARNPYDTNCCGVRVGENPLQQGEGEL